MSSLLGGASDALTSPTSAGTVMAKTPAHGGATAAPTALGAMGNLQTPQISAEARIWQVSIDKLSPGQFQPRAHFEKAKLEELAQSIKEHGILQPIVARKVASGKFEIIAGERRWRAAQIAGLHEVPVILKALEDQATLEMSIIENIQREDLNAIEEAEAYSRLAQEFSLTQQQIAEKVGKERATVANALRLLQLPQQIREMIVKNEISQGHAKVLLSLPDATQQLALARKVVQLKMSVRQLEKAAAQKPEASGAESQKAMDGNVTQRLISGLAEEVQKILGTKVTIDYLNSKGKISIHFYSDDELTEIVNKLKGS
jgi:ParB family chromosome partitioning protein